MLKNLQSSTVLTPSYHRKMTFFSICNVYSSKSFFSRISFRDLSLSVASRRHRAYSLALPLPWCVSLPLSSDGGPAGALITGPMPPPPGYLGLPNGPNAPGIPNKLAAPGNCNSGAHGGLGARWAAAAAYNCSGGGSTPDSKTILQQQQ